MIGALLYAANAMSEIAWGAATNGLCVGTDIRIKDGLGSVISPDCSLRLWNTNNIRVGYKLAELEKRYQVVLYGPDGNPLERRAGTYFSIIRGIKWSIMSPGDVSQVGSFSITNVFEVRTNGLHTLVASVVLSTNQVGHTARWLPPYFSLPPVTNTFILALPEKKKINSRE